MERAGASTYYRRAAFPSTRSGQACNSNSHRPSENGAKGDVFFADSRFLGRCVSPLFAFQFFANCNALLTIRAKVPSLYVGQVFGEKSLVSVFPLK